MLTVRWKFALIAVLVTASPQCMAQVPAAIATPDLAIAGIFHADGAQVYECMRAAGGRLEWIIREPIATLTFEGNTVGRHYRGPRWEHTDGSSIIAQQSTSFPAKAPNDIPWLKLKVTERSHSGFFDKVTWIQRINTDGGALSGSCDEPGELRPVPYSADYVFLRKD